MQGTITERVRPKGRDSQGKLRSNLKVYDISYRYTDPQTGKKKQTTKRGFLTKGEAQRFLLELNNQFENNTFALPKVVLVRDYLLEWLSNYVEPNLRPSTIEGYKRIINNHLLPHLGNLELKQLKASHIDKFYAYLLREGRFDKKGGLSAKSVLYTHRVLNEALDHAIRKQLIFHNPVKGATNIPKPKKYKGNIYSPDEIIQLLALVKNSSFELPIALAAICGLRRGECLALTIEDINFENKTIRVNKQLIQVGKETLIGEPKSEDSNRIVSAPDEVFDIIKRQIQENEKNKELFEHEYEDNSLLICQSNGKLIKPPYFSKNFTNLIKQNKLKKIRFHDLRHSCASLMLRSGVAMKTASQILGHSSIGITADLYTHVLEDTKKEAAIQIGKELFKERIS